MSHDIESIAWTNEVPWHGLGVKVDDTLSPEEMLKAAKLDWTVSKRTMRYRVGKTWQENDHHFVLARDSDNQVLDVVGRGYVPTQNTEAFEFFNDLVHAGDARMDTAGSLKKGKIVWGLAKLNAGFTLPGKDRVEGYLLLCSPHQQGKALTAMLTATRVVCNNTLTAALRGSGSGRVSFRHVVEFDETQRRKAQEMLGIAREQVDEFKEHAKELVGKTMSRDDQEDFLINVFDSRGDRDKLNKHASQAIAALDYAPGAKMKSAWGTAWGTLNAVTYVCDHLWRPNVDNRMYDAWFSRTKTIKAKAFVELLDA